MDNKERKCFYSADEMKVFKYWDGSGSWKYVDPYEIQMKIMASEEDFEQLALTAQNLNLLQDGPEELKGGLKEAASATIKLTKVCGEIFNIPTLNVEDGKQVGLTMLEMFQLIEEFGEFVEAAKKKEEDGLNSSPHTEPSEKT